MGNACVTLQPIKGLNASFQLKGKRERETVMIFQAAHLSK